MKIKTQKMYSWGLGILCYPYVGCGLHIGKRWIGLVKL